MFFVSGKRACSWFAEGREAVFADHLFRAEIGHGWTTKLRKELAADGAKFARDCAVGGG